MCAECAEEEAGDWDQLGVLGWSTVTKLRKVLIAIATVVGLWFLGSGVMAETVEFPTAFIPLAIGMLIRLGVVAVTR